MRLSRVTQWVAVLLCLVTGNVAGGAEDALESGPVLFHVSFDAQEDTESWPKADYARGRREFLNRTAISIDPDGRFGECVRWSPPRGDLGYDTAHNIRSEQGTIAFWLKLGDNAATEWSKLIIIYGMP